MSLVTAKSRTIVLYPSSDLSMDDSTPPLEGKLLINQLELVTPTTVAGAIYGISFTLFCLYVHALVPRLRDETRKGQAKFMLAYSIVIMLCGLYNLVANAWADQDAYIKHSSYPGGPYIYIESTFRDPAIITGFACQTVIDILTSAIQVWRVWVIWSATRYAKLIIVLPALCFLTFTALQLRTLILETTAVTIADITRLGTRTIIATFAIRGATTIICTVLISMLLVFHHWQARKLMGNAQESSGYMKIVALLIESYALESTWLLIEAILQTLSIVRAFFIETQYYIEIIAYLLVQYRVASGKAYESEREQSHIGSLHWNHSHHTTTQFGATSEAGSDHGIYETRMPLPKSTPLHPRATHDQFTTRS